MKFEISEKRGKKISRNTSLKTDREYTKRLVYIYTCMLINLKYLITIY
jgi:hypothetical protein